MSCVGSEGGQNLMKGTPKNLSTVIYFLLCLGLPRGAELELPLSSLLWEQTADVCLKDMGEGSCLLPQIVFLLV